MKSKACVLGLLMIAVCASLEASSWKRFVGLTVTGQAECWNQDGTSIDCPGTGQDGEYQKGWTLPGTYPRFSDNGNGTVTDRLTGLTWLKDSSCLGQQAWAAALSSANTLANGACGLTDGSAPGAWRLPNLRELQSLIDYQVHPVTSETPALPTGHPFSGVQSDYYWTSTTLAPYPSDAWFVNIGSGTFDYIVKATRVYVWPVRRGQW